MPPAAPPRPPPRRAALGVGWSGCGALSQHLTPFNRVRPDFVNPLHAAHLGNLTQITKIQTAPKQLKSRGRTHPPRRFFNQPATGARIDHTPSRRFSFRIFPCKRSKPGVETRQNTVNSRGQSPRSNNDVTWPRGPACNLSPHRRPPGRAAQQGTSAQSTTALPGPAAADEIASCFESAGSSGETRGRVCVWAGLGHARMRRGWRLIRADRAPRVHGMRWGLAGAIGAVRRWGEPGLPIDGRRVGLGAQGFPK
jgi:hypothetical protein